MQVASGGIMDNVWPYVEEQFVDCDMMDSSCKMVVSWTTYATPVE